MIGLDTNVLLRAFVNDDPAQAAAARQFLANTDSRVPRYVGVIVLVEFAWSLRRTYGYPRPAVLDAIRRLLDASDTIVERRDLVASCISLASTINAELADLLIGQGNLEDGCERTLTFDRKAAQRIPGMELLS